MLTFANVVWGARCGESARRVLLGETRSRGYAYSVRLRRESALEREAPHGLLSSRLVSTIPFDRWMAKHHPNIPFERFADDLLCHCESEIQARELKEALERRFADCGLELHPSKTKIVYRKDDDRRGNHPNEKFTFLGYEFRPRRSKNRWGRFFVNFSPGASTAAMKAIREHIRVWQLGCRVDRWTGGQVDRWIDDLARMFNPVIRGWLNYYGRYYKSALYPTLRYLNRCSRVGQWRNTNA